MSTQGTASTTQTQQPQKPSAQNVQSKPTGYSRPATSRSGQPSGSRTSTFPTGTGKRKRNRRSRGDKGKPTGNPSQQKRNGAKLPVRRGPEFEYISVCCKEKALKPPCGQRMQVRDPETGKQKEARKGLGHWRCSGCKKACKVTPRKPQPKEETNAGTIVATVA